MPKNKNQFIRLSILNNAFRNKYRKFTIYDLMDEIYEKSERYGQPIGPSERTVRNDIRFMRDMGAPVKVENGYYFYEDKNYDFFGGLTDEDKTALIQLKDFLQGIPSKDFPSTERILQLLKRYEEFGGVYFRFPLVVLDTQPHAKGLHWLDDIYDAIELEYQLKIDYDAFDPQYSFDANVHPFFIREYNNRWFLIGKVEGTPEPFYTIPLDRINRLKVLRNKDADMRSKKDVLQMFDSVVGVTVDLNLEVEDIELYFRKPASFYVKTKPLHHSQEIVEEDGNGIRVRLKLRRNYELKQLILTFVPNVRVLKPETLYEEVREMLVEGLKFFEDAN